MADRLGAAIRLQTISWGPERAADAAAFEQLHAFLETAYPAAHRAMTREKVGLSLVYRWPGKESGGAPIAFLAHQDVVPVEPGSEAAWTHPPFDGVVADGKVWGRGAVDDKGSIIALMEAVERLAKAGFRPSRDVYILLGHDEEQSGLEGARRIAELLKSRGARFEWTLDEGSALVDGVVSGVEGPVALLATAEKGYATLRFDAVAEGGHSSAPGRFTAVSRVAGAVVAVSDHPYPVKMDADSVAFFEALAPELPFAKRLMLANLWLTGPLVAQSLSQTPVVAAAMRTTTAPTMIAGGVKENVLPQRAQAFVNYRIHPRDTVASVKARAEKLIDDPKVTVTVLGGNDPSPRSSRASKGF
ncbi:MAG: M20/M25/M40 family metallo-hydrolase, partial [Parvularculaceae bacterium]|nr:M20/M25/M40 family metallo-hydrolase [Parvularculaceae bacterium]